MTEEYFFLFTIGPVQSFIAQARKSHDLQAGSFLLSKLIDFAMKKLSDLTDRPPNFLFPNIQVKYKPNRFLAKIETKDPEEIGNKLEKLVKVEFEKVASNILQKLQINLREDFKKKCKESFFKQVSSLLEIFWVLMPIEEQTYKETFIELERNLGAIKNIRPFIQLNKGGEWGRKCSLCGERSSLFFSKKGRAYQSPSAILIEMHRSDAFFKEDLCAICFTKRFINNSHYRTKELSNYPSTAEIALLDTLNQLKENLYPYKELFREKFDPELYFEENLTKRYFKLGDLPVEKIDRAKTLLKSIKKNANEAGLQFSRYYALIMFDGDNMGKWLSGGNLIDSNDLQKFHNEMSIELGKFAKKVEKIITKERGRLVYAGGDDVLAFVNLNHLLSILKELRKKFPNLGRLAPTLNNQIATASCGVCIAHYKTPLSTVRYWSKRMELEAKEMSGKDALGIAYLRHSGPITKTTFKWEYEKFSTIETFEQLIKLLHQQSLSGTFIRKIGDEFLHLMDKNGFYGENELIETELKRLVTRSYLRKRKEESREEFEENKKKEINTLVKKLMILYNNSESLKNFLSFLELALLFERRLN